MSKIRLVVLAVVILIAVATLLVGCSSGASRDDLDDLESQITVVSDDVAQLQQQLDEPADGEAFLTQASLFETLQNPSAGEPVYVEWDRLDLIIEGWDRSHMSYHRVSSGDPDSVQSANNTYFLALNNADLYLARGDTARATDWMLIALSQLGPSVGCSGGEINIASWVIPERLRQLIEENLGPLYTVEPTTGEDGEERYIISIALTIFGGC